MFFNYLKTGIRNLLKYKVFSFINVFGLAAALSVGMLILLMLADEKSHDQFNVKKDRIYRILCDRPDFRHPYATSPYPLASVLESYPIVETTTHLVMAVGGDASYERQSVTMVGYFADTAFFHVFSYDLERGDRRTALAEPNSMVITHALAWKLFGDEEPVGKVVAFADRGLTVFGGTAASKAVPWGSFRITGVIADHPYRSHLRFDVLVSAASLHALSADSLMADRSGNWKDVFNCFTYVLLAPGKTSGQLNTVLGEVAARQYAGISEFKDVRLTAQPLTRISPGVLLGNEPTIALPMMAYYFLSFLALVVLVCACLNYINLSLARALKRSREIGVRKVAGAGRLDLVFQFLGESVLTAFMAMGMAAAMLLVLRWAFLHLWVNQYLNFDLPVNAGVCAAFLGFALFTGVVAGIYPAFYLSRFEPVSALKSTEGTRPGRLPLRKVLSVAQFVLSLFFIITSILIYNQFRFFLNFKYEFRTANILNVDLQGSDYQLARRQFAAVPGVAGISACEYLPATPHSEGSQLRPADPRRRSDSLFTQVMTLAADEHFIPNLGLKLLAGQGLSVGSSSARRYVVVNEAAVRAFGYPSPAQMVGAAFETPYNDSPLVVVGVVQNFHMRMLLGNDTIEPLVLLDRPANFRYLNVRIASQDMRSVMAALEKRWHTIDPVHAFSGSFFDEQLASESQGIFDVVSILGYIAFLVVVIACLGMLGMATYTAERRRREVGIRKVLGAGDWSNTLLLSREFIQVLLIAISIAAPLSYLLNAAWLRKFPNRVDFGWGTVLEGVTLLLTLGIVTIASQTVRASKANPVEALRRD